MRLLAAIFGFLIILVILWDAFETIVLPRRVTRRFRLTSLFYRSIGVPWHFLAKLSKKTKRRESFLGLFGPLSVLMLLALWAVGLIFGYAAILWAIAAKLNAPNTVVDFGLYVYLSGVTFFTLGYGDVTALAPLGRTIEVIEAANGLGLLAIVIGYLPVLYQAFSRREVNISLLDARAGSPSSATELLRRYGASGNIGEISVLLHEWENWSAELLESHVSYPVLCYFRSQHDNQSWLGALTTVLDTCALVIAGVDEVPVWQAQLTFAIARHAVVDIAQIFRTKPSSASCCDTRLPPEALRRVREILATNGTPLRDGEAAERRLLELRLLYEPYVVALSEFLLMPLPPWILPADAIDNWKTSAWGRIQ
jgi:hypothetical protein